MRSSHRLRNASLLILAVLVLWVVVSELLGWRYLRGPVQSLASNATHRTVTLVEPFRVYLIRPTIDVSLGGATISAPPWSTEPHFVDLKGFAASVGWGIVFGGPLHFHDLTLAEGDIRAERKKSGQASWMFDENKPADTSETPAVLPRIDHIGVGNLKLKYVDELLASSVSAQIKTVAENGKESLFASGDGKWKNNPLSFEVRIPELLRVASEQAQAALAAKLRIKTTELTFDGSIADVTGIDGIQGNVTVKGQSLGDLALIPGLTLPETPPFQLRGSLEKKGKLFAVKVASFEVGSSRMYADLVYEGAQKPPLLRGALGASRLVLQDLGPAIGSEGKNSVKQTAGAGASTPATEAAPSKSKVLPSKEFDIPSLKAMNAEVDIDLKELDLGTEALRPLRAVKTHLGLRDGLLALTDLKADLAGGSVTGSTSYDSKDEDKPPKWKSQLNWRRVDLQQWVMNQGRNLFVTGRFSGDTGFAGTGKSTAGILGSLDGSIKGRIEGGAISHLIVEGAGLDVAQALGVFVSGPKPLALSCAVVDVRIKNGDIQTNSILNTSDSALFVTGGTNLKSEALDLRVVLAPKDWSPLSLRTPILVTGTFGSPSVGVEKKPLAVKLIAAAVLGAVFAPAAAIVPLIDLGSGEIDEGCSAAAAVARDSAARDNAPSSNAGNAAVPKAAAPASVAPRAAVPHGDRK